MTGKKNTRRTLFFVAAVLLCLLLYQLGQWYFRNRREASFYRPIAALAAPYEQVLVLGSTAAAREVLKNQSVQSVDLVLTAQPLFRPQQSRLHCYTEDAFQFLKTREKHYDFIIVALTAPKTETEIARLPTSFTACVRITLGRAVPLSLRPYRRSGIR